MHQVCFFSVQQIIPNVVTQIIILLIWVRLILAGLIHVSVLSCWLTGGGESVMASLTRLAFHELLSGGTGVTGPCHLSSLHRPSLGLFTWWWQFSGRMSEAFKGSWVLTSRLVQCHFCHICSLEQVRVPTQSQQGEENRICLLMAKHFSKGKGIRREIPGSFCNSWPCYITHPLSHRL